MKPPELSGGTECGLSFYLETEEVEWRGSKMAATWSQECGFWVKFPSKARHRLGGGASVAEMTVSTGRCEWPRTTHWPSAPTGRLLSSERPSRGHF